MRKILLVGFAILVLLSVMISSTLFLSAPLTGVWEGCTWQPDYCFASCVEYGSTTVDMENYNTPWQCPTGADVHQCEITVYNPKSYPYGPGPNAGVYHACDQQGWFGSWRCTSKKSGLSQNIVLERGQWINPDNLGGGYNAFKVKIVRKVLMRCGTAGCQGGGVPIAGAQGCSWNIGTTEYHWADNTTGVKSVPFGTGYQYVCSQHLVSCPSDCSNPMLCSVPSNLRSFIVTYKGQPHWAYVADGYTQGSGERIAQVIGCKVTNEADICTERDLDTGDCLSGDYEHIEYSQCGTVSTFGVGGCAMDSDCRTDYYCDWDDTNHRGECKPVPSSGVTHQCEEDSDCDQTGGGCFDENLKGTFCINNKCQQVNTKVDCCSIADCPSGYFCNSNYECQVSDKEQADCPYDCCDQRYNKNDADYKQKTCPSGEPVCCPEHTCAETKDDCKTTGDEGCTLDNGIIDYIICLLSGVFGAVLAGLLVIAAFFVGGIIILIIIVAVIWLAMRRRG